MQKTSRKLFMWAAMSALILTISMGLLSCMSERPENLGLQNDRLSACPDKPNCVCSFENKVDKEHFIEPLPYTIDEIQLRDKIIGTLQSLPRTKIITKTENYIHAECTSRIFRFVDDLEIFIDQQQKLIHFRSASRVGHSDLGVNRKRVESIKASLTEI